MIRKKTKRKEKKVDPASVGNFSQKIRALRHSKNLRFKKIYHPPDPMVLFIFCSVCLFFYLFFTYYVPNSKSYENISQSTEL